jgi:hypothetical protein
VRRGDELVVPLRERREALASLERLLGELGVAGSTGVPRNG